MNIKTLNVIDSNEWDKLVQETFGKPYCFQQQYGCQERGLHHFSVPDYDNEEDSFMHDQIPEIVNHKERGVKFAKWLNRPVDKPLSSEPDDHLSLGLWWERNFYPDFQTVVNNLYERGLIKAGRYAIEID